LFLQHSSKGGWQTPNRGMFKFLSEHHSPHMNTSHSDTCQWVNALLQLRRTTLPKRLRGPGPNAAQKARILEAAAAAPDHDQILPWRFIEVPDQFRSALGDAFADALLERDPQADQEACTQARDKAKRSPWLLLAVVRTGGEPKAIPAAERILSAGAAIQNMLIMATALDLGSALTSGKGLQSLALRTLFTLKEEEQALCFINIGHIGASRKPRDRPEVTQYFSVLA